ncbi:MAG: helix-turn-helix domain-containing protein [Myxococcota bacterium]
MAETHYPVAMATRAVCSFLELDPADVLRDAGLSSDVVLHETRGVTAAEFFAIWEAVVGRIEGRPLLVELGIRMARGAANGPMLALTTAPDLYTGLERATEFKVLMGPTVFDVSREEDVLRVGFTSADPRLQMPPSLGVAQVAFQLELVRNAIGVPIAPRAVETPLTGTEVRPLETFAQAPVVPSEQTAITYGAEDAARPLVSKNDRLWAAYEPELRVQLEANDARSPASARVRHALRELLPDGYASLDDIAVRMGVSRRTLQRRLREEGITFQQVLDEVRCRTAIRLLRHSTLRVDEIAQLLAFQEPNSFTRAFHGWTGRTPTEERSGNRRAAGG